MGDGKRVVLPRTFKPSHYKLSLRDLDFTAWTFKGTVVIDLQITQATRSIVVNTHEISITSSKLAIGQDATLKTLTSSDCTYLRDNDSATISFDEDLPVGESGTLTLEYEGSLNSQSMGFYRSQYKAVAEPPASVARTENGLHYMLSTQFQPAGARRALPCFDEPNMKASFEIDIEIPEDQVAISNTPVKDSQDLGSGLKRVWFDKTPVMSTYLLAWAVGDFKYVEKYTTRKYNGSPIPVRVYATAGQEEEGHYAAEEAAKAVDFFSETFGIDYPLAKLDLLATPEFVFGAMENWGLITSRPLMLFDEKTGDPSRKEVISCILFHEVAHQWFGNLVTMEWWDELWLNEGFATWVSYYGINHFYPEWNCWETFLSRDMESAFVRDAMRSSHPIHMEANNAEHVHDLLDMISYQKSCSVLNMLATALGAPKFLEGVSNYLKQNMYKNATKEDLWRALSAVSGDDVVANISPWIDKIGHPVLTIEENEGRLTLKQSRFLSVDDMTPEEDETVWWIPLGFRNLAGNESTPALSALTSKEQTMEISAQDALYVFNSTATGFYRVEYPEGHLAKLGEKLEQLTSAEKLTLLGSTSALAFGGSGSTVALLSFARAFARETDPNILSRMLSDLFRIKKRFEADGDMTKAIQRMVLSVIDKLVKDLGWEKVAGEPQTRGKLRATVLEEALLCGSAEVKAAALQWNVIYDKEPEKATFDPSLRRVVWGAAAYTSPKEVVPALIRRWRDSTSSEIKVACLVAIGFAQDPDVLRDVVFPFIYGMAPQDPVLEPTEMRIPITHLAFNGRTSRYMQWDYIKDNWDAVTTKMGTSEGLSRVLAGALPSFNDAAAWEDLDKFFKDKDTAGYKSILDKVKDNIETIEMYRKREHAPLAAWLKEQGYFES